MTMDPAVSTRLKQKQPSRPKVPVIKNYLNGVFVESLSATRLEVTNPANGELLARVPLSTEAELEQAVEAARSAFPAWRKTPPLERARYFFRLKSIMEERFEEIARVLTIENGKILAEARGSVRRAIENVEVASGIPSLMQGATLEDVAAGIDTHAIRRPIGVFAAITPFNFPAMVPLWFLPYAVACGNTFILKPSEQVPMTPTFIFELLEEAGFPPGVVNLVHGGKEIVNSICTHPGINGVSFVGSSPVAEHVYSLSSGSGKRVQALGGAKNFIAVAADANLDSTVESIIGSCFGCAGERCLAASVVLGEEEIYPELKRRVVAAAAQLKLGDGLAEGVTMGPVVSRQHRERVLAYVEAGIQEGAELILDGRGVQVPGGENGFYVGPTIFDRVTPSMTIAREEIFGPVLALIRVKDLDAALDVISQHPLANTTSLFTTSGAAARKFRYTVEASMIGINIGVPAPMAFFSFGGAKGSFFGDLKAHGRDGIEFYTDKKVVITRWPE